MKKNLLFLTILTLILSACKDEKVEVLSKSARIMTSYKLPNQVGNTVIRYSTDSGTVKVFLPKDASTANISPEITVSDQATVSPASGAPVSFVLGQPFDYTVTAQSGLALPWYVTVKEYVEPAIVSFAPGIQNRTQIAPGVVTVEYRAGTSVSAIAPVIGITPDATISPASGTPVNFSSPKTYTLTHTNGMKTTFVVTFLPRTS